MTTNMASSHSTEIEVWPGEQDQVWQGHDDRGRDEGKEEVSLQYDETSNLYYDTSSSPIKYYHWNPKDQAHMLVIIPEKFIDEWGYFREEEIAVDVDALMQHSKKKKKMSSKRKKMKEEKFLAKKARAETNSPVFSPTTESNSLVQDHVQTSRPPSLSEPTKTLQTQNGSSRRPVQQIYQPPHLRSRSLTAQEQTQHYPQIQTNSQFPQSQTNSQLYPQINPQQYPNTQPYGNLEAYASYYNSQPYNANSYNSAQAYDNSTQYPQTDNNPQYPQIPTSSSTPSTIAHSLPATTPDSDDMDLQPRSYREYAEANYNEYAFPGNDISTYLPENSKFEEETEEQEEEELKTKKNKKKKKEKAEEPVTHDYMYYAKLFSKHVQVDYKVGENDLTYTADNETQQTNTTLDNTTAPPSSSDLTTPSDTTPVNDTDTTNITNPTTSTDVSPVFDFNALTPEQQQYMLQYYQYYQQQAAQPASQPSLDSQQPSITSPTPQQLTQSHPESAALQTQQPHKEDPKNRTSENGNAEHGTDPKLLDMEFDVTSQLYYLRSKGWYYDPSTALYMDMNDFPATLYHWNNAVSDWWQVSESEVYCIFF